MIAGIGVGYYWLLTATDSLSTPAARAPAGHWPLLVPTGRAALNKPSLALPLPNGDYLVVDSANHRVIVVNARTKAVVWQYGQTKVAGASPGQLNKPTSRDCLPPDSLLIKNAATMGAVPR